MIMEDLDALRFEEAFALLEEALDEMRRDGLSLDHAVALYERGTRLASHCDRLLEQAELRITELAPDNSEAPTRSARERSAESGW